MGTVYAVVNQKGGVGKTTTAVNLAAAIAQAGRATLLVDVDPQANATSGVGVDKGALHGKGGAHASTYDLLINETPIQDAIQHSGVERMDVVPGSLDLAGAEIELMPRLSRETHLRRALAPVRDSYDFLFVDAPPSLGLLTINALVAADRALIPIQCEYYALEGVTQLMRSIELVKRHMNPELEVGLVVMTMYDNRVRLAQQVVAEVRRVFGDRVSETVIPRNVRLSEAPSHGAPVMVYDPRSRGAVAYRQIAQEVMRLG